MRNFVFLIALIFATNSWSNQIARTNTGREIRWSATSIPLVIRTNSLTMNATDIQTIIQSSIAQWNSSSPTKIQAVGSAASEIKFLQDFSKYGSAVVGVTELSYNDAGSVYKAGIYLNEQNFVFNTTQTFQATSRIFLGDVVTHELGHLFGLAHSEVLNSSMFYSTYAGQSTIAFDDRTAIQQKYNASNFGSISGTIQGGNHVGVLGVHVQAISRKTGDVASTISDENGLYTIGGLDFQDTYYIYTSPLKNLASLPKYYSNVQSEFCPGTYLGSFYSACGTPGEGIAQGISLTSSEPHASTGVISISCSLKSNGDYSFQKIQPTFSSVTIFDYGIENQYEKAFVGYFRNLEVNLSTYSPADKLRIDLSDFTELSGTTKYVQFKIISQSLANALEYKMDVLQNTNSILALPLERFPIAPEMKYSLDLTSTHVLSSTRANNIFDLEIQARKLGPSVMKYAIPEYKLFSVNSNWPYLVVASLMEMTPSGLRPLVSTEAILSDNSACLEAPFTFAVSKTAAEDDDSPAVKAAPSCGTIEPPEGGGPTSQLFIMSLGFLVILMTSQVRKRAKKFLS